MPLFGLGQCFQELSAERFYHQYYKQTTPLLLDVQTENEYNKGHIPKAISAPDSSRLFQAIRQKAPGNDIFLYCAYPDRAKEAARILCRHFEGTIFVLDDTLRRWRDLGYPYKDTRNFFQKLFNK